MIAAIDVELVTLSDYLLRAGERLRVKENGLPGLHYVFAGEGSMVVDSGQPITLRPHTLVIVPPGSGCMIEAPEPCSVPRKARSADARPHTEGRPQTRGQRVFGGAEPGLAMSSGSIRATLGTAALFPPSTPL